MKQVVFVQPAGIASTPDLQARIVIDVHGVEWEVYDESDGSIGLVLDWDHMPQFENPGLIFCSRIDRRRVWPCPPDWRRLSDQALLSLIDGATSIR